MSDKADKIFRASKIETAKRLKGVRDITATADEYNKIKDILVGVEDGSAVEKAITGLSEEDEFVVLCRLMETTTHLVRLDQAPVIEGDYIVPDFLARFQPGCFLSGFSKQDAAGFKCFVEVKSTNENKYTIKGSLLRRRKNYAIEYGLPLLFAVRFTAFYSHTCWVIVSAPDGSSSLTVTLEDDLLNGLAYVLWDDYFYMVNPTLKFERVYDPLAPPGGSGHRDYGRLNEFRIISHDGKTCYTAADAIMYLCFSSVSTWKP